MNLIKAPETKVAVNFVIPESGPGEGEITLFTPEGMAVEISGEWMDLIHFANRLKQAVTIEMTKKNQELQNRSK